MLEQDASLALLPSVFSLLGNEEKVHIAVCLNLIHSLILVT